MLIKANLFSEFDITKYPETFDKDLILKFFSKIENFKNNSNNTYDLKFDYDTKFSSAGILILSNNNSLWIKFKQNSCEFNSKINSKNEGIATELMNLAEDLFYIEIEHKYKP